MIRVLKFGAGLAAVAVAVGFLSLPASTQEKKAPSKPVHVEGEWVLSHSAGKSAVYKFHNGEYTVNVGDKVQEKGKYKHVPKTHPAEVKLMPSEGHEQVATVGVIHGVHTLTVHKTDKAPEKPVAGLHKGRAAPHSVTLTRERVEPSKMVTIAQADAFSAGNITLSLTNNNGYIQLNWDNPGAVGYQDFVALYDHDPTTDNDPAHNYLTGGWQWVNNGTSYCTGWGSGTGKKYWIAYISWDYKVSKWEVVATATGSP